jgi:hypothetical protein
LVSRVCRALRLEGVSLTVRIVAGVVLLGVILYAVPSAGRALTEKSELGQIAHELFSARRAEALNDLSAGSGSMQAQLFASRSASRKSTRKAFFLSLLLPGLGQRYLGQSNRAKIYMGAEAGVWIAVAGFRVQGSLREDRYREYAEIVGGADPSVADDDYYKDLALYGSSDVHALVIRWEARALFPDDRDAQHQYYLDNIYPEDKAWSWPNQESFDEYQRLRRRSRKAYRTSVNLIGLAVLNRLVSAIDTVTGREKEELVGGMEPQFSVRTLPGDLSPAPFVYLTRSF